MVRRSTPASVLDDRHFPVRVRIAVPPNGFGTQLDAMHGWLNLHAGRGHYAIHGAHRLLTTDAVFFYFDDTAIAHAFVQRFACGVAVAPERIA